MSIYALQCLFGLTIVLLLASPRWIPRWAFKFGKGHLETKQHRFEHESWHQLFWEMWVMDDISIDACMYSFHGEMAN